MTAARHFLFLQGPPGPFFVELADGLAARGHRCARINVNGGDRFDWPGDAIDFTGAAAAWPGAIRDEIARLAITDIVLFGDCRPLHRTARRIADDHAIPVHVFEEGYIRPDWVTLERGGVNGFSSLPRDPAHYLGLAGDLPPVPSQAPIRSSFVRRAIEAIGYHGASRLRRARYPGYEPHRPDAASAEAAGWMRRLIAAPITRARAWDGVRRLGSARYFVLPLQLDSDYQLRVHSDFASMVEAMETVIASFARHAPAESRLVVKLHPLDNGLRDWRGLARDCARRHGVAGRVLYLGHGDIARLVRDAEGVATVNSTTGTLALEAGVPVIVLGRAVYDVAGITHQGDLDLFWRAPQAPQVEIYEAFRRVLVAGCLLRGGFSSRAGRKTLVPAAVAALIASPAAARDHSVRRLRPCDAA